MSSTEVFYGIKDVAYWAFLNTLEPIEDKFWMVVLVFGFLAFGYWMYRQVQYNKIAENDPNQIK